MERPDDPDDLARLLGERLWLRRLAAAMARGRVDQDDLEQEAWLAALRRPPRGSVRGWFRTVLRNRLRQEARGAARAERRERAAARPEALPPTDEIVARAEAHRAVVLAVFELEEPLRTTVLLRFFEGLGTQEVAVRTGVEEDTVRARLRRALGRLRGRLDREGDSRDTLALLLALPQPALTADGPAARPDTAAHPPSWNGASLVTSTAKKTLVGALGALALVGGALFWAASSAEDGPTLRDEVDSGAPSSVAGAEAGPGAAEAAPRERSADASDAASRAAPRPAGASAVSGDVRRASDDAPAAGVLVTLAGGTGAPLETRTDERGTYLLDPVPPGGPFRLTAAAEGAAPAVVAGLHLARDERRTLDTLYLDVPVVVEVTVRGADGAPVADAAVEAHRVRTRLAPQDWAGHPPEPEATATTGPDGGARLSLGVGTWAFRALHADHAPGGAPARPLLAGGLTERVEIRLERGFPLAGRVTWGDEPLRDGRVLLLPPSDARPLMEPTPLDPLRVETRTDEDGRYRFAAVPAGAHSLGVVVPGGLPARVGVVQVPPLERFDVHLDGGTISGRVTEEGTGAPLEGALVRAAVWRRHSPTFLSATTGPDGRYRIRAPLGGVVQGPARGEGDALARTVHFEVVKSGYVMAPVAADAQWRNPWALEGSPAEIDVVLRRAAALSGVVSGPGGLVAGAEVVADVWDPERGSIPHRTRTDSDGRYRFEGLPAGRARLVVTRPGYVQVPSAGAGWRAESPPDPAVTVEIPRTGAVVLDLRLERGSALAGRVEDEDGAPVPAALVAADGPAGAALHATSDAAGAFRLDGLVPGRDVEIRVSRPGFADARVTATAPEEPLVDPLVVRLSRTGTVAGRVLGPDGRPVPGAFVQAAPARLALEEGYEIVSVWQRAAKASVAPDGTFEVPLEFFDGAIEGGVVVRAAAPGFAPTASEPLPHPAGGRRDGLELRLGAGHVLRGRVVADDGSGPVAGAEVEFQNQRLPPGLGQPRDWSDVGRDMHPFEIVAKSGPDGIFEIRDLPPWRYELRVIAGGYRWAAPTVVVPLEDEVVVELTRTHGMAGSVVYADGSPVGSALVLAQATTTGQVLGQTETDSAGAFRLDSLASGSYRLAVRRPSDRSTDVLPFLSEPFETGATDVRLVVERGAGTISGRCVTSDGSPVPGAWLHFKPADGGDVAHARSRSDGSFVLSGLAAERYVLTAEASRAVGGPQSYGTPLAVAPLEVALGARDVRLEFRAAGRIAGRVVREDGAPLAGRLLLWAGAADDPRFQRSVPVRDDGGFEVGSLAPGDYALFVEDGSTRTRLELRGRSVFPAGATDVELVVAAHATIAGRVLDEAGRPVPGVTVRALRAEPVGAAVTDQEGRFQLGGLDAGADHRLEAREHATGAATLDAARPGGAEVQLVLRAAQLVAGRVVDASGGPVRNATVELVAEAGGVRAALRTDSEGRFTSRALPAGTYRVTLLDRGGAPLLEPLSLGTVRSGAGETTLSVELR